MAEISSRKFVTPQQPRKAVIFNTLIAIFMHPNYVVGTCSKGFLREFNTNQVIGVPKRYQNGNGIETVYVKIFNGEVFREIFFEGSQAKMDKLYAHLVNGSLLDLDEGD